jgi:hypothetical protein
LQHIGPILRDDFQNVKRRSITAHCECQLFLLCVAIVLLSQPQNFQFTLRFGDKHTASRIRTHRTPSIHFLLFPNTLHKLQENLDGLMTRTDLAFIWIAGIWSLIVLLVPPLNFIRGGSWYLEAPKWAEERLIDKLLEEKGIEKILEKEEAFLATLPPAEDRDKRIQAPRDSESTARSREAAKTWLTKDAIENARKTYFRPNPAHIWKELFAVWIPSSLLWLTIRWRSIRKKPYVD